MEEASAIALDGIFGGVGIGYETPRVVRAGGYHQCVPDRVLAEELLDEAVEHIAKEAHLWTARDWAVMVVVHGKLSMDGGLDTWLVEMVKNVGEDDGAVCVPSCPSVRGCKMVEDLLGVELEGWRLERGVTIDDEVISFRFGADRLLEPVWVEVADEI